jgi:hypothetical protein
MPLPDPGFTELTVNNVDVHVARIRRDSDIERMLFGSGAQ